MSVENVAVLEIEGKQFPLKAGRNYLVGRKTTTENAAQLDIELQSQTLDAKHALIRVCDDETKILDLYSKSGTFLNKQRLEGLTEATLATTGSLQLGELVGSILFNAMLQSHDSSGFHDGPKNSSDFICSSPEPTALSGSRLKQAHKSSLTSTPNAPNLLQSNNIDQINTQCNFLIPHVPHRKSDALNTSRVSLSKSSLIDTNGNKTIDSFCIPETQQRPSIGSNSTRDLSLAESDAGVDSALNSRVSANADDNDFCIPETQEVAVFSSSQARKRYQAERAMLEANMPANIFAEEDENTASIVGGSQFRICTQDFNEVDCFGDDDSNSSDLLADAPCSIVIPRIQHDAVLLNNSGHVLTSEAKEQTSATDKLMDDKEMSALQWSEQGSRCSTLHNEPSQREGSCTPDLFDLPDVAQQLAKEANDLNDINCVSSKTTSESKIIPVEFPSTSFKAPTKPVTKVNEPKLFEDDDDDLLPTQVFSVKAGDAKKVTAGKCSPEYLTLSDKENIIPAAVAILEAVDFMEATQLFADAPNINLDCSREDEQLSPPMATTNTAVETSSNATCTTEPEAKAPEDDDDLLPTQRYPVTKAKAATYIKTSTAASSKFLEQQPMAKTNAAVESSSNATSTTEPDAKAPEDDDDLLPTQRYPVTKTKAVTDMKTSTAASSKCLRQEPMASTTTAVDSSSNATCTNEPDAKAPEDDDDLLPTQIYEVTKSKATTDIKTSTLASRKFLSSTLQTTSEGCASDDAAFFGKMNELTPPMVASSTDFLKPLGALAKKSSTLSNASMSESPDIDLLLCTPQIIVENFVKHDEKAKKNLIAKQKTLFGDDSDEGGDVLELINAPKVSHDFDKLLPHLKKAQLSPKLEEVEAKLHQYNRSFDKKDDSLKAKLKGDKKVTTRSRDERHLARDKQRDKKTDNVPKAEQKIKEESKKQTRSQAASKTDTEKSLEKTEAKKPGRKRKNVDVLTTETAEKLIKKADEPVKIAQAKPAAATTDVGNDKQKKVVEIKQKVAAVDKKEARSEIEKPRIDSTVKLKQDAAVAGKVKAVVTRRTTRSSSHSQSSNSEQSVDMPPRRITRLKSRIEGEPITESSTPTTSLEVKKKRLGKKINVDDKQEKQDVKLKDSLPKNKKHAASSSSNSSLKNNKTETKSNESVQSSQERRKRLRSTSSLVSANCSSSSSAAAAEEKADDAQKLRPAKKLQVSMTMVDSAHFQNLTKNAPDIWTVAKDPVESDILIMDKGNRTFKFLIAMAKGIPIVTSSWLEIVNKNRQITSMVGHLYADESFEKRYKFSLLKSIEMARKQKLFAGYHFLMTPGIKPQPDELTAIIKCAGGTVHVNVPTIKDNQKLYLVTSKDDQKLWHKYRRLNNKIIIISSEGIISAVMRQIVKPLDTNLLA